MRVELTVNGRPRTADVEPRRMLSELLREDLGLTGTHLGCEHGVCGACTVLDHGQPVRSCLMLAVQAHGADIVTIEGLRDGNEMGSLQRAFYESMSFQCGFCTPGFVMTAAAFLAERETAGVTEPVTPEEVREAISGNLCRCTGYESIVDGVCRAAGVALGAAHEGES